MKKPEHRHALILFARDPLIGQVKTRLRTHLDDQTILGLYKSFLNDSVEKICAVPHTDRFCGVYPSGESEYFRQIAQERKISIFTQQGSDLGERMKNALAKCFGEGYEKAVIIGADSPSLPVDYLNRAFASEKDLTLGPCTDGGYYLIGARKEVPDVFSGVSWGSDQVLSETLALIRRARVSLETLPVWYDVDRFDDMRFLKTHLELLDICGMSESPSTGEYLREMAVKRHHQEENK